MNSKERVKEVLAGHLPDRVPINYVGANSSIEKRLLQYFGLKEHDMEGLLNALNVDFRVIEVPYIGPKLHNPIEGIRIDELWGFRTRWVANQDGGYWDFCDFPLKDAGLEEVLSWPLPNPDDFDYSAVTKLCRQYKDYFVVYGDPGLIDVINSNGIIRMMEQVLIDLVTDDPVGLAYINRKASIQAEIAKRVLNAADGGIDLVWIGEDLGTQHSPLISLDVFRKNIRPFHQKIIDIAKASNLPVMIHSCGSSSWAFEDFIEMGIKIVDTLQPEAANMSPEYLKKRFGGRLCFNGCISTAGPMAYGTKQETIDYVKNTFDIMMPGGGYIMSPTHMLQDNSPTENVAAAYETAYSYGKY